MNRPLKYPEWRAIAIGLIAIGGFFLFQFALPPALYGYTFSIDEEHCSIFVRCVPAHFPINYTLDTGESTTIETEMMFKSTFVFAVDIPIRYNFTFVPENPELIKEINIIIVTKPDNFTDFSTKSPIETIDDARDDHKLIELIKQSDGTFKRKAQWTSPIEDEVRFVGIIVSKYDNATFIPETSTQIELKGIESYFTAREAVSSERSNAIIIGLTWTGVAAIFVVLGVDILLRIRLRESEVDKWFDCKSKIYS